MASVALAVTVVLTLALPTQHAAGYVARGRSVSTYRLAPGLALKTIRYSTGPVQVRALVVDPTAVDPAVDPARALTLDIAPASPSFPGYAPTSTIAQKAGAIAGVNGDFYSSGRPIHPTAVDADLWTLGMKGGAGFAVTKDETHAYAGNPREDVTAHVHATGADWTVARWNSGQPGGAQIAGFTRVGGSAEKPPKDACAARLLPDGGRRWSNERQTGISRTYAVDAQPEPCPSDSMALGSSAGVVVLAAQRGGEKADEIKSLDKGDKVTLTWTVGWNGAADWIGAMPQLLVDADGDGVGEVVAPSDCASYFCGRNPRTGVGVNKACVDGTNGCRVYILVVDGRQSDWSIGMRLDQFAKEFKKLGAAWAVNFDGGGAASMYVRKKDRAYCEINLDTGCLVNRPADSRGERKVVNALVVLPGLDSEEPEVAAPGTARPAYAERFTAAPGAAGSGGGSWRLAMTDPGSTGGLLDALAGGAFGRVPAGLMERYAAELETYRNAAGRPTG